MALENGVARTPAMGWNSWNKFGCNISEGIVKGMADVLAAKNGLADAGYRYLIVDDCWMASNRDAQGQLYGDPERFPSGMKALADYVHSKGLKFGLYESPTQGTCQRRPGSYGHEAVDAATFANWGVDYLKHDWCQTSKKQSPLMWKDFPNKSEKEIAQILFTRMRDALAATKRPIGYSLSACCSALDFPSWAGNVANLWRTSTDINDSWSSVIFNFNKTTPFQSAAGTGKWNDPDMLEVGNGGMTTTEYYAHFGLWAMLAAPLIAGNDLRSMDRVTSAILSNHDIISVDQDVLGVPADVVSSTVTGVILSRPLANGDRAVAFLNTGHTPVTMSTTLQEIGLPVAGTATLKELNTGVISGTSGQLNATVPGHGLAMYRVTSTPPPMAGATELVGKSSGRCLDVSGASNTNGTKIIIWDCHGAGNQQFVSTTNNELRLSSDTNMCIDMPESATSGSQLHISKCDLSKHQQFRRLPNGTYQGVQSGLCFDVKGGVSANGTDVIAYTCNGNLNQVWTRR
ncbi:ricin-type beta-trefoil lectin domain protein [Serratia rubidaea]|nr:ricin-type beta-trefoil lectin domain protein [Serratia rubidaea]